MLFPAKLILDLFEDDEFKIIIITGDHGFGKSSYANQIISEVNSVDGVKRNWKLEMFKDSLGFHPMNVTLKWLDMKTRRKVFHWDDAGLWLNAMDYQDRFVVSVGKYLQAARTDWATLLFTCIDKEDVFAKLRNLRSAIVVEIVKNSNWKQPNKRTAFAYEFWKSRTGSKKGTNNLWSENFNCLMPGNYSETNPVIKHNPSKQDKKNPYVTWGFYGWYKPLRIKYAQMAKRQMRDYLVKQHKDIMKYQKDLEI